MNNDCTGASFNIFFESAYEPHGHILEFEFTFA